KKGSFEYFKLKMQPYVNAYNRLYGITAPKRQRSALKADGAILTIPGYHNYGNVVQRYALQTFLKKNGYNFISYVRKDRGNRAVNSIPRGIYFKTPLRVVRRFLRHQKPYWYIPRVNEIYKAKSDAKY